MKKGKNTPVPVSYTHLTEALTVLLFPAGLKTKTGNIIWKKTVPQKLAGQTLIRKNITSRATALWQPA